MPNSSQFPTDPKTEVVRLLNLAGRADRISTLRANASFFETPEQQQQAVQDMAMEAQGHRDAARNLCAQHGLNYEKILAETTTRAHSLAQVGAQDQPSFDQS